MPASTARSCERLHALRAHRRRARRGEGDERLEQREADADRRGRRRRASGRASGCRARRGRSAAGRRSRCRRRRARSARRGPAAPSSSRSSASVGGEELVLRQLDHDPVEVVRQRGAHLGETSAPGLTLSARKVCSGRSARAQRGAHGRRLERRAEPAAVRLVEPLVGRRDGRVGHAGERLVAGHAARRELEHRLEDGHDRALVGEQRLDLGALPGAGELAGEPTVVAAALAAARPLGPVERAVGELEQPRGVARVGRERGDARRARQRPPRRP